MEKIGIIGGSGLYEMEGVENLTEERVETPFGMPSDNLMCGKIEDAEVVFLARHGRGHRIMPSELNYKANIYAMKRLGVSRILSVSAVGSFKEELAPRDIVMIDQFFDKTKRSADHTFFGDGIVAHVQFAHPICEDLQRAVYEIADSVTKEEGDPAGADRAPTVHLNGTYLNMEGPAFSTKAESRLYRSWGMDVIGMTNLAEAKLAREAQMCYCTMAMVTDYDAWHEEHEAVSVEMVVKTLLNNATTAKEIIRRAVPNLARRSIDKCGCPTALQNGVITQPDAYPEATRRKLQLLLPADSA